VKNIDKLSKSNLLLRNSFINLIGQIIPIFVAIITIPYIVKGLGLKEFGILSLCWAIISCVNILDISLNKATNKFISEELGKNNIHQIPTIIWSSVLLHIIMSSIIGIIIYLLINYFISNLPNISPDLLVTAKKVFYILIFIMPIILITGSFRSVLEAFQRFDIINLIRTFSNISIFVIPIIGILLHWSLILIIFYTVIFRFIILLIYIFIAISLLSILRFISISFFIIKRIVSYGVWLFITSLTGPIITYIDRFFIGSLLSLTYISYYSAPYDGINRLGIIATSFASTLFPTISMLNVQNQLNKIIDFLIRSLKYIILIEVPIIFIIIAEANKILQIWLGNNFAIHSTIVFQLLTIGIFINSTAIIPFIFLQSVGRADLPAKFHLIELPIYIVSLFLLIKSLGIIGAALAFIIRILIDTILLYIYVFKLYKVSIDIFLSTGFFKMILFLISLIPIFYFLKQINLNISFYILLAIVLVIYYLVVWTVIFDIEDKKIFKNMLKIQK